MSKTKKRSLICLLTGHIDHGKSQIVEAITGNQIIKKEAGKITQKISAINACENTIKKICKPIATQINSALDIPGLLLIDSPGHASFTNLRKRGGNIADMAVLVIDIKEGIKPQTIEALEILKRYKTPFIVAANKVDLIHGWTKKSDFLIKNLESQSEYTLEEFNKKFYELVGELYKHGFESERFDKVEDYTKQIAIVPISAKTQEGLPELLMVLTGLAQKFLEKTLEINTEAPAKGVILEIKKDKGVGTILNTVIYEGTIKNNDKIIIGGIDKSIETKVKCLFSCDKGKPQKQDSISAAAALDIVVTESEGIFPGMPIRVANQNIETIKQEIQDTVDEVIIETDNQGIIVKADSLGSLEAIIQLLKENHIQIKRANIGNISKKDIAEAKSDSDKLNQIIVGFNVEDINSQDVKIIIGDVIYKIVENINEFREKTKKQIKEEELKQISKPFKIKVMRNYIFRQNNPAVVGVEVLAGTLKIDIKLLKKDGSILPEINSIQEEGKPTNKVETGKQVAVSIQGATVGRQINEDDIFYSEINEIAFRKLKDMKKLLNTQEIELLKEIAEIKRKQNPLWGV